MIPGTSEAGSTYGCSSKLEKPFHAGYSRDLRRVGTANVNKWDLGLVGHSLAVRSVWVQEELRGTLSASLAHLPSHHAFPFFCSFFSDD